MQLSHVAFHSIEDVIPQYLEYTVYSENAAFQYSAHLPLPIPETLLLISSSFCRYFLFFLVFLLSEHNLNQLPLSFIHHISSFAASLTVFFSLRLFYAQCKISFPSLMSPSTLARMLRSAPFSTGILLTSFSKSVRRPCSGAQLLPEKPIFLARLLFPADYTTTTLVVLKTPNRPLSAQGKSNSSA